MTRFLTTTAVLVPTVLIGLTSVLAFTPLTQVQPNNQLSNTDWSLIKITNEMTNKTEFADSYCGTTLHFDSTGHYKGYSGWNDYSGEYAIDEKEKEALEMNNPIRTKRGGDPKCKLGETLYSYFPKIEWYFIKADTLILATDSISITFKRK